MKRIWILGILALVWGCKTSGGAASSADSNYASYQENLAGSLPQYPDFHERTKASASQVEEVSVQSVDGQLDEVQRKIYEKNKAELYFNGYTVLVFSGVDRNKAFQTQQDLNQYFPEIEAEMQYQQPRYLVKIGKYAYKIEAQKVFSQIKGVFPTARIIQDRFQRPEFVSPNATDSNVERQN